MVIDKNDDDWWRGAVIYQIYPRSFQDSNGDGIGDLKGITKRLSYIADLGVDAIWISPFFTSPMKDFGYDVSDYCDIDPLFGTLADFDEMLATAHGLGLRIMIDLVLSHTSDKHDWFQTSRKDKHNDKADWYVWADAKEDGTPPNNWLSIFGGCAWQWDGQREQYYLHNFLTSQPDLNLHNEAVQDALLDIARFWLDRGVDGFRLDTINFYFHDKELRNNPPMAKELRNSKIAPAVNPYNHQEHIYDRNRPENLEFLRRFRSLLDEYGGRTALGEIGDAHKGLELLGEYTKGHQAVHMCYAFDMLSEQQILPNHIMDIFNQLDKVAQEGWACWALSNHDVIRHKSRWNLNEKASRLYPLLLICLKGSSCFYQGEELGLDEAVIDYEDLQDPYGIEFWPEFKGRDGCRTPMVWEESEKNAGFSPNKPWLPIMTAHQALAVNKQDQNEASMLNHYRQIFKLSKEQPALRKGEQKEMKIENDILQFTREFQDEVIFCAFNFAKDIRKVNIACGKYTDLSSQFSCGASLDKNSATIGPWQAVLIKF